MLWHFTQAGKGQSGENAHEKIDPGENATTMVISMFYEGKWGGNGELPMGGGRGRR